MATSLKEAFIRAAKARAIILAELKNRDKPMSMADILGLGQLAELDMKVTAIQSCVYAMLKSGLLAKSKVDATTYYGLASVTTTSKVDTPRKAKLSPAIQVDIIKATGRVRLSLNGLVIEIGVE